MKNLEFLDNKTGIGSTDVFKAVLKEYERVEHFAKDFVYDFSALCELEIKNEPYEVWIFTRKTGTSFWSTDKTVKTYGLENSCEISQSIGNNDFCLKIEKLNSDTYNMTRYECKY